MSFLTLIRGGNKRTKVTENFLLSQPDVLDASVWVNDGQLLAHVTISAGSNWTSRALQAACTKELGAKATPTELVLFWARTKAA